MTEQIAEATPSGGGNNRFSWTGADDRLVKLGKVEQATFVRTSTGLDELDRVLGGGLVEGSVILVGGDPGIGKSTILMQLMHNLSKTMPTLYCTGEESPGQTKLRAIRLGVPSEANIDISTSTELEKVIQAINQSGAKAVVVDSIQTIYSGLLQAAPGTVSQVRECAAQLTRVAKLKGITLIFVGHVTKEGEIAGPRVLEHIVDTVLYFEGESGSNFRMLRANKNRFGTVNELGVFSMEERGLVDVSNPSSMFLTAHESPVAGSCVTVAMEGNRPFLVEVQALSEHTQTPNPKRAASGLELNRVNLLLAVLSRHIEVDAGNDNVYAKVVGGIRLTEPAADVALLVSLYSSLKGKPVPEKTVFFGEVGLVGEVRAVANAEARVKEAAKLGFTTIVLPSKCEIKKPPKGVTLIGISRVSEIVRVLRG